MLYLTDGIRQLLTAIPCYPNQLQLATRQLATSLRQLLDYYLLLFHAIPNTTTMTIRQLLTTHTTSSYLSIFVCLDINSGVFWTMFQRTDFSNCYNIILIKVSD